MQPQPDNLPAVIDPTPLLLIQQGIDAKISPRDMKDLFDLQVRYEQRQAEQAYAEAITAFQAACPPIRNSKAVRDRDGRTIYSYAPFDKIIAVAGPHLRANRIVYTFDTNIADGLMHVACRIRVGVVEKVTTTSLPVPAAGKLTNDTQAAVGAITFGKRTSFIAALGIVTTDEDTDGIDPHDDSNDTCTPQELNDLNELMKQREEVTGRKVNVERWLAVLGATDAFNLTQAQRRKATDLFTQDINAAKAKKEGAS